jgi:phytoene synthase
MRPEVADLDACRALLAAGSKSFALAARVLPARIRDSATVLYAFCRIADDLVDADPHASAATIDGLRARVDAVYAGAPAGHAVDRALAAVVAEEAIPRGLLDALLEGMAWDAAGRRYRSLEELQDYAARVAGTVGVMMSLLMGARDPDTLARAAELGVAMQLTNIARDVGEDARRGRLYLPVDWLGEVGVDADRFVRRPWVGAGMVRVVWRLLDEAERLYRRAEPGIGRLPPDCQAAIRAARLIYGEIGAEVARASFDSVRRRAVVPGWRKAWLLLRSVVPPPEACTPEPAPLEAVRFLIETVAPGPQAMRLLVV